MNQPDYHLIRRNIIKSVFHDSTLMETFTLKGGNALQYSHNIKNRSSIDIDLSMKSEFKPEEIDGVREKLETSFREVFFDDHIHVFDVKLDERPESMNPDFLDFWGGYKVSFKIIYQNRARSLNWNIARMQREAISISRDNNKSIFKVDISKHEYCEGRVEFDIDGYLAYSYSLPMILFEKLRAICQQTDEYRSEVVSTHKPRSRARDFLDIYHIMEREKVLVNETNVKICQKIFEAKRVPMGYLGIIYASKYRELHRETWETVLNTTSARRDLKGFDFYFDYVTPFANSVKGFRIK